MLLSLALSFALSASALAADPAAPNTAATTAPTTDAAAPVAPVADGTTPAAPICATSTTNSDGSITLSDPTLPVCGPDGLPVPAEQPKGKKQLKKSNNGRMEAEETRE